VINVPAQKVEVADVALKLAQERKAPGLAAPGTVKARTQTLNEFLDFKICPSIIGPNLHFLLLTHQY